MRNRYRITGSNNSILLTVPLEKGRDQQAAMSDIRIFNNDNWQVQHWRTLVSVYKRAPFFEFYEDSLRPFFEAEFTFLADFNITTLEWTKKQLKLDFVIEEEDIFQDEYPAEIADLRGLKENGRNSLPRYYQVFEDRIGFIPDLSILDLLFSEGPAARDILIA